VFSGEQGVGAMSKVCERPDWQKKCSASGDASIVLAGATRQAIPKEPPKRSSTWIRAVQSLEYCVLCGVYGVQAAHRNEGKGKSQRNSDALTAALCVTCHHEIDNGKALTKEERRARLDRAIVLTLRELFQRDLVRAVK
jgi:hypothetical protein